MDLKPYSSFCQICEKFNETLYGQLQAAYAQLGKTQAAMDQLHMHFTSAIQNTALKVIKSFVGKSEVGAIASGKQYNELCKVYVPSFFTVCFLFCSFIKMCGLIAKISWLYLVLCS